MSALAQNRDFQPVFGRIRDMFRAYEASAVVLHDESHRYYLGTHEVRAKDGYRTWFGGVEIKKAYVSAHLLPVYIHPRLLDSLSLALKKRMQGKACFNFSRIDDALLAELAALVSAGAAAFKEDGRLTR